jgi:endogenous inhibitor of DNA gyrase (YacG/DUF329 family)
MSDSSADRSKGANKDAEVVSLRPPRPCPICGKPSVREFYPFDSRRCADIDLHRWLSGAYAIPAEEAENPSEEESSANRSDD